MNFNVLAKRHITLQNGKVVVMKRSTTPLIILIGLILIYFSVQITGFNMEAIIKRIDQFFVILKEMMQPNFSYTTKLWQPLFDTIKMSLLGSILGAIVAVPIAFCASSNIIKNRFIVISSKFFLSLLRTLPTLIMALMATFIFGLGTMAGFIAIFLFTIAYVGKLLYEQIENADMKAYEAMHSMGLTTVQSFRYAILPQVLPNYLSTTLFCFEGNVRYASILGYVGAGGIGLLLNENLGWRNYANIGMILVMLIVTVFIIETISEHFRKKLM